MCNYIYDICVIINYNSFEDCDSLVIKCCNNKHCSNATWSWTHICGWILENNSKSHMKSGVFLHVFNDISNYAYVFP